MILNGVMVMAVTLRYFTEFGKPAFQYITASICGGKHEAINFVVRVRYIVVKKVHVRYLIS